MTTTEYCCATDLPNAVGTPTCGTCPVGMWNLESFPARRLLASCTGNSGSTSRRRPAGRPILQIHADAADMQVWLIDSWTGTPVNVALDEHDAIGWFQENQLAGLRLAHDSYLAMFTEALAVR